MRTPVPIPTVKISTPAPVQTAVPVHWTMPPQNPVPLPPTVVKTMKPVISTPSPTTAVALSKEMEAPAAGSNLIALTCLAGAGVAVCLRALRRG
jgi:hypothetical protein